MISFLIVIYYYLSCVGAGLLGMRVIAGQRWMIVFLGRMPLLSTGFILGQAFLAALWVGIALLGFFRLSVLTGISLLILVSGLPLLIPLLRTGIQDMKSWAKWLHTESFSIQILAVALLVLVLGYGWAAWMMPPIGDAEAFYVTYARIISAAEKLEPMPGLYEAFSSIGLLGELHFAALIKLSGIHAAKIFVWLIGLDTAVLLAAVCRVAGVTLTGQLFGLVLLFTSTTFTNYLFDGKIDIYAAALGLAAVLWIIVPLERSDRKVALAIAGLCIGFAIVSKFSYALGFLPAIITLIVLQNLSRGKSGLGKMKNIVSQVILIGLWATLATLPHLIKNAVFFGAPLAPFIGGGNDQNWLQQVWFPSAVTQGILVTYPLALVFAQYPMQGGNLSWVWLAFLPLVWWLPKPIRWHTAIVQLCIAGAVGTIMWIILRPSIIAPRYFLTTLLLFYPLVVKAAEKSAIRESELKWFSFGIFLIMFIGILNAARYPLGIMVRDTIRGGMSSRCAFASSFCEPLSYLSQKAGLGDRVYFAAYYSYWMRDDLLQCRDQKAESKLASLTKPKLDWNQLVAGGFKWIVIDLNAYSAVWKRLSDLPKPLGLKVHTFSKNQSMIILKLEDSLEIGKKTCRQSPPPAWLVVRTDTK